MALISRRGSPELEQEIVKKGGQALTVSADTGRQSQLWQSALLLNVGFNKDLMNLA